MLISWERMCSSKDKGGLGMRDFSAFNNALLAKQCWRLATNPTSFAATVLRGKYFLRTDIWEEKIPQQASFTWRSIMSARELVKEGSRWVVGNGRKVKFWKDAWVKDLPGGRIMSIAPNEDAANSVAAEWMDAEGDVMILRYWKDISQVLKWRL